MGLCIGYDEAERYGNPRSIRKTRTYPMGALLSRRGRGLCRQTGVPVRYPVLGASSGANQKLKVSLLKSPYERACAVVSHFTDPDFRSFVHPEMKYLVLLKMIETQIEGAVRVVTGGQGDK